MLELELATTEQIIAELAQRLNEFVLVCVPTGELKAEDGYIAFSPHLARERRSRDARAALCASSAMRIRTTIAVGKIRLRVTTARVSSMSQSGTLSAIGEPSARVDIGRALE